MNNRLKGWLLILFCAIASISFSQNQKFTVASWNIGHFALGKSNNTTISHTEAAQKQDAYRKTIDSLKADILAVVEYNPEFVCATDNNPAIDARSAIFQTFDDVQIGPKFSYNCNCLFSKGHSSTNGKVMNFADMVQKRYYMCATYHIAGKSVKIVSTHLDWNEGQNGAVFRAGQIREIIEAFKDEPYVIMCADWNVSDPIEYNPFLRAGYQMANHGKFGDLPTFPASKPKDCLDNIIAKGFNIDNVKVINEPLLSDHSIIKADLTPIP